MSELNSAYPVSGGLYFWSFMLAQQFGPAASWAVGYLNLLGQVSSRECCSAHTTDNVACPSDCLGVPAAGTGSCRYLQLRPTVLSLGLLVDSRRTSRGLFAKCSHGIWSSKFCCCWSSPALLSNVQTSHFSGLDVLMLQLWMCVHMYHLNQTYHRLTVANCCLSHPNYALTDSPVLTRLLCALPCSSCTCLGACCV